MYKTKATNIAKHTYVAIKWIVFISTTCSNYRAATLEKTLPLVSILSTTNYEIMFSANH
jgi:hypothetical protein